MSEEDIYGKDPYEPGLWQRIKDWWNCLRGNHHLPLYISTGIYECSRCDYQEKTNKRVIQPEIYEALQNIKFKSYNDSIWLTGNKVSLKYEEEETE